MVGYAEVRSYGCLAGAAIEPNSGSGLDAAAYARSAVDVAL